MHVRPNSQCPPDSARASVREVRLGSRLPAHRPALPMPEAEEPAPGTPPALDRRVGSLQGSDGRMLAECVLSPPLQIGILMRILA
eukprot:14078951-Alexandrium_andersonii.AAC.1